MQSNRPTHYDVLEIKKNATTDEIKAAYKVAALQWHPDRSKQWMSPADHARFKDAMFRRVHDALEVLSDASKRYQYDNPSAFDPVPPLTEADANWHRLNDAYIKHLATSNSAKDKARHAAKVAFKHADVKPEPMEESPPASPTSKNFTFNIFSKQNFTNPQFIKVDPQGLLYIRREVAEFKGRGFWFINFSMVFSNVSDAEKFADAWNKISEKVPDGIEMFVHDDMGPDKKAIVAPINLSRSRRFSKFDEENGMRLLEELDKYANISPDVPYEYWMRCDEHGQRRKCWPKEVPVVQGERKHKL